MPARSAGLSPPVSRRDAPSAQELLDALPYGVVVLEADGTVVSATPAAHRLVPGLENAEVRACEDLFSCKHPGGP